MTSDSWDNFFSIFVPVGMVAGFVIGFGWLIWSMLSDDAERDRLRELAEAEARFAPGQMVRMKAFGTEGMVIRRTCWIDDCHYTVRFAALEIKTNTSWFGDGPVDIAPIATISGIREYELERM